MIVVKFFRQLKICLFVWLVIQNKILTRENLKKNGWYGPRFCSLCRLEDEDTYHLFQGCSFAKAVWFYVLQNLKLNEYVEEQILEGVLQNWIHNQ